MKRTIKLTETTKVEKEVELKFPIYRKVDSWSDHGNYITYHRIDENLEEIEIDVRESYTSNRNSYQIEIKSPAYLAGSMDYVLGRGEYQSSETEFNCMLRAAIDFIKAIK